MPPIRVVRDDIDHATLEEAYRGGQVGCDIETSGLKWNRDHIATFQLALPSETVIVRLGDGGPRPALLSDLMTSDEVLKVFHHAAFDLRFLAYAWSLPPAAVACTKVAAKIVRPGLRSPEYSLKPLLQRYLGVAISKAEQTSDWTAEDLTPSQVAYAAADVDHLVDLLGALRYEADAEGVGDLVQRSFDYLPTRVALDLRGSGDVYRY